MPLDRDTLAKSGDTSRASGSRPRRGKAGATAPTTVSAALGADLTVTLKGQKFTVSPLDFNDLIEIEKTHGETEGFFLNLAMMRPSAVRWLVWLVLKKRHPDLTEDQVGTLLPIQQDGLALVLQPILCACGLVEEGAAEGNAPEEAPIG